jgi:hypothetical protein
MYFHGHYICSRKTFAVFVTLLGIFVVTVIVTNVMYLTSHPGSPISPRETPTRVITIPAQSPPSALVVSQWFRCGHFKDLGPAANGWVLDSGSCWRNHHKYAIDVFPTKKVRDKWLGLARKFGVQPLWVQNQYVVYPSVPN